MSFFSIVFRVAMVFLAVLPDSSPIKPSLKESQWYADSLQEARSQHPRVAELKFSRGKPC
jgi:hypothetical protein